MENNNTTKWLVGGAISFIILVLFLIFGPIVIIGAGQRGVVFNSFSGVEPRILGEGTHLRIPFVENVIQMPARTQSTPFEENTGSSDSQTIDVRLTVNWHLDPAKVNKIYQETGNTEDVVSKILTPILQDSLKASISKYVALDIQRNRDNVSAKALKLLQSRVKRYDVLVDTVSITNIQFDKRFNDAVEETQVAQQQIKKAEYEVQTAKRKAEAAIARADGDAQAQRLQQQTLTPDLLQKMAIEKWKGEFPQYYGGGVLPFLNLPSSH